MNWKTIADIKVYYIEGKGIHHIVVKYVEFDRNNHPIKKEVVYKGEKAYEVLNTYVTRTGLSSSELIKYGKLAFLDYYEEKEKESTTTNIDTLRLRDRKMANKESLISKFKPYWPIPLIAALVAGGCSLLSRPTLPEIVHYRNPDKRVELSYDEDVVSNALRAKTIFNNLIEQDQMVSEQDIDFLIQYFVNAGITNTDYKENDSFTEFKVASALFNAGKERRDDVINSRMGSLLMNFELEFNQIFHPNSVFERYNFNEQNAYEFFIYVTTLLHGGEEQKTMLKNDKTRSYRVATKDEAGIFRSSATPLERIVICSAIKGLLSGSYEFKYKHDINLTCYSLPDYTKEEYIKWLDTHIAFAKSQLIKENTLFSGRKR